MDQNKISLTSFNVSGLYKDRIDYVKQLLSLGSMDIIMLQETWLLKSDLSILSSLHEQYLGYGKSAVPDHEMLAGRPYGGLAFLYHKSLAKNISHVRVQCDRIDAVKLTDKKWQYNSVDKCVSPMRQQKD